MLASWLWASARRFAPGHDKRQQRGWRRLLTLPGCQTRAGSAAGLGLEQLHQAGAVVVASQGRAQCELKEGRAAQALQVPGRAG